MKIEINRESNNNLRVTLCLIAAISTNKKGTLFIDRIPLVGSKFACKIDNEYYTCIYKRTCSGKRSLSDIEQITIEQYNKYKYANNTLPLPKKKREITIKEKIKMKYNFTKKSAERRGLEFNLTPLSIRNILLANKDYYTGLEVPVDKKSIDRIDSSKGYVKGNVCMCDARVNCFKDNLTLEQIEKIYNKMRKIKK